MGESISFDRAASFYDATRRLPAGVAEAVTRSLLTEIRAAGAERLLEVGIGTGRMARPLMAEGLRVTGVDISPEMMAQLRAQLGPQHTPPDLLLGDATRLPLRDDAVRAVLVVHVLHLVASVEGALAEIRRVLAPGGVLLHQTRRAAPETQKIWDDSHEKWGELFHARGFVRRQRTEQPEVRRMTQETGAHLRVVDIAQYKETVTVDEEIARIKRRSSSWTWHVPDDVLDDALPEYEDWFRATTGDTWVDDITYEVEVWRWD